MKRKIIIGSVALGVAASAVLLAVLTRRAPAPTPPDAFEEVGPVAHALGRPGGSGQAATSTAGTRQRPADVLEAALEAVAAGRRAELSRHFANAAVADPVYRRWHGAIPIGSVRVATPDEIDAGAENGHVVPVTVWLAGTDGVAGLQGEAGFAIGAGGVRVRHLRLDAMPLVVPSWTEAARRVAAVAPSATPAQKLEAPFYGIFHLMADKRQYTVDAMTGRVDRAE